MKTNNQGTQINNIEPPQSSNVNHVVPTDIANKKGNELTYAVFGLQTSLFTEVSNMHNLYKTKHGILASIPLICRNQDCSYKDVCLISPHNRIVGSRCPMEISAILSRYEQWCTHFGIDVSRDYLEDKDIVDATLVKDLVSVEIQMMRAENKIALNGDFMTTVLLDIDRKCNPYFGKDVSPETKYLMTLQDKKMKILNQLNATRKDQANDKSKIAASDIAVRIFQQAQQMEKEKHIVNISDMDFTEITEESSSINETNNVRTISQDDEEGVVINE